MSPRKNHKAWVLLFAGLFAAGSAWALKTDKNQPINVRADHGDFKSDPDNNSNGTGIYTGHVVITQGSIVLTADRAVLHVINNELDTADITGNPATFQQQPDHGEMMQGTANEITYNASNNEVVLITNARLTQAVNEPSTDNGRSGTPSPSVPGERLLTADRIRYDTDTQHVIAKAGNDEERVHISFPPKTQAPAAPVQHPQPAPTSAAAPAAASTPAPAAATHGSRA